MNADELKERYRGRLLARIDALAEAVAAGTGGEDVARQFHSIVGIAGTIGYPEATRVARQGERAMAGSPDPGQLRALIATLRDAVEPCNKLSHL
jgi:HPt (histidine-containing phosphotransfer) domain-containing protein